MPASLSIEVIYALPNEQVLLKANVPPGTTMREAIALSGLMARYPELELNSINAGIWSKRQTLDTVLADGDRVEIYRPLLADPKEARRRKVKSGVKREK